MSISKVQSSSRYTRRYTSILINNNTIPACIAKLLCPWIADCCKNHGTVLHTPESANGLVIESIAHGFDVATVKNEAGRRSKEGYARKHPATEGYGNV
jgi:hypothetical protein